MPKSDAKVGASTTSPKYYAPANNGIAYHTMMSIKSKLDKNTLTMTLKQT